MRKEAYKRCVQQAEQSSTTQTGASGGAFWRRGALSNRFININKPGEVEDKSEDNDDNTPEAIHDEDVNSATKQENGQNIHDNNEDKRPNGRRFPQLYEIAKVEGDKEWLEWLQAHVWTYVGLAAPLLGSPGPLRSVLSGENMGLPFSDEEARELELCKSYFFVVCSCIYISGYQKDAFQKYPRLLVLISNDYCTFYNINVFACIAFGSTSTVNPISTKMG